MKQNYKLRRLFSYVLSSKHVGCDLKREGNANGYSCKRPHVSVRSAIEPVSVDSYYTE